MTKLFRNDSPGALTLEPARELEIKRHRERRRQAAELAAQGRGEDTEIAHVAHGEVVVPEALQTPEVLETLARVAAEYGIVLGRMRVGDARNSINPNTEVAEFTPLGAIPVNWNAIPETWNKLVRQGMDIAGRASNYVPEKPEKFAVVLPPAGVSMSPPSDPPSDEALNYSPNGPGLFKVTMNDVPGALSAAWHGLRAWQEAKDRYGGGPAEATLHNGEGDAWRHARVNQRLANDIGAERAKAFADWNERRYGSANPVGERKMDLANNQVGRGLPGDTSKFTIDELVRSGVSVPRPIES